MSSSSTERERKFLVTELPAGLRRYPHRRIRQGYLVIDPAGPEARVRQITRGKREEYVLTVKHPTGDSEARREIEVNLSPGQFAELWPLTKGQRLEKTRYDVPHGGHKIEVDVYRGSLSGLAVAEVEFVSRRESRAFRPPAWMQRDISDDKPYGNKSLARKGLPKGFRAR